MKRILIVDDNTNICQLIKAIFIMHNYQVEIVSNINNVCPAVYSFNPDIIFMHRYPDGIDGLAISRELKEFSSLKPMVILYAETAFMKENINETEADDILIDSFDAGELMTQMNDIVQKFSFINELNLKEMKMSG